MNPEAKEMPAQPTEYADAMEREKAKAKENSKGHE
jgi:hypothetical protein